jgi:uncharacterized damage-inducible protein DinB
MSMLKSLLLGGQAFASVERMLAGLTLDTALKPVPGVPFTLYGVLWHLELCQDVVLKLVAEEDVAFPAPEAQWPGAAPTPEEWEDLLERLRAGLYEASELAALPRDLPERDRELLEDLTAHNAYHWGQVVLLRRLLGDWQDEDGAEGMEA